jgi:succinoglycan biosynthesis transport protein ExoP
LAVGLLLGVGAAFLIDFLDDSIRTAADVDKVGVGMPVLAVVPVDPPSGTLPVALSRNHEASVEAYRALRTNVQFLGLDRKVQVIQVTSAMAGEGKTTTAANLAIVLAQTGNSVVLVDADLRRPRVHRVFGIDGVLGLTNNLVGESIDMTLHSYAPELSLIVSGVVPPNPSEMLSGKRMGGFIAELKSRFDYVVIDSAPTLAVSDAVALSQHVDGVLMVVQAGRTTAPQLHRALATLEQVSAPLLGLVLNRAKHRRRDEYLYAYTS